ncbi:uncharacterized protein ACO6RY_02279 [Pungitius sinensis]
MPQVSPPAPWSQLFSFVTGRTTLSSSGRKEALWCMCSPSGRSRTSVPSCSVLLIGRWAPFRVAASRFLRTQLLQNQHAWYPVSHI